MKKKRLANVCKWKKVWQTFLNGKKRLPNVWKLWWRIFAMWSHMHRPSKMFVWSTGLHAGLAYWRSWGQFPPASLIVGILRGGKSKIFESIIVFQWFFHEFWGPGWPKRYSHRRFGEVLFTANPSRVTFADAYNKKNIVLVKGWFFKSITNAP